jgi:hypothetical protein
VFRELGDRAGESMVLSNLGSVLFAGKDREGAAKLWLSSLAITDEYQDVLGGAPTRQNLSAYYADELDWMRAISYAEDAKRVWRGTDEPNMLAESICRLAALYLEVGRGHDVERQLDELDALRARLSGSAPPSFACVALRADAEAGRGHPERAVALLRPSVDGMRTTREDRDLLPAEQLLARYLAAAGDDGIALQLLGELGERATARSDEAMLLTSSILRLRLELQRGDAERGSARFEALEAALKQELPARAVLQSTVELEWLRARLGDRAGALRKLKALSTTALRAGAVSLALEATLLEAELRAEGGTAIGRTEAIQYAKQARAAGRPGWADRMERLTDRGRRKRAR